MCMRNNNTLPYIFNLLNFAKLKTHALAQTTLCVKNLYGCVPGKLKECAANDGYITEPEDGQDLCRGDATIGFWPKINERGAQWDGCEMQVERANGKVQNFLFCAKFSDGTIYKCTENGCE